MPLEGLPRLFSFSDVPVVPMALSALVGLVAGIVIGARLGASIALARYLRLAFRSHLASYREAAATHRVHAADPAYREAQAICARLLVERRFGTRTRFFVLGDTRHTVPRAQVVRCCYDLLAGPMESTRVPTTIIVPMLSLWVPVSFWRARIGRPDPRDSAARDTYRRTLAETISNTPSFQEIADRIPPPGAYAPADPHDGAPDQPRR